MNKLLRDQKLELEDGYRQKRLIPREAEQYFGKLADSKLIKVITGIRRCGKSAFAYLLLQKKAFAYLNFDDERLQNPDTEQILAAFYEIYGKDLKWIFLDEIQNLERWELFVNRLQRAGFNLFLTGSNAKLLSRELATHLTGRHLKIEIFPFSFREYLRAVGFKDDAKTTRGQSILKKELANYITSGGFPEIVVDKENAGVYLRELYRDIVDRDIINRHSISYKKTFREIAISLLSNPGRSISCNKLKKQFNLGSEHTIKNYLSYLEDSYLIFPISRFSHKPIEIEKSDKKIYAIDSGIIKSVALNSSEDLGHMYENIVAIELLRRKFFGGNLEIYYWKNIQHEEVDFIIKKGLKIIQLIQVCYNPNNQDTKSREIKALTKASEDLRCNNLLVLTHDFEGEERIGNKRIRYTPLWKWLIEDPHEVD